MLNYIITKEPNTLANYIQVNKTIEIYILSFLIQVQLECGLKLKNVINMKMNNHIFSKIKIVNWEMNLK